MMRFWDRVRMLPVKSTASLQPIRDHVSALPRGFWHASKIILTAVTIIALFVLSPFHNTRADIVVFRPDTCIGSWNNADRAVGDPDDEGAITSENSAEGKAGNEMTCRDFNGEIPEGVSPEKFFLTLRWKVSSPTDNQTQDNEAPESQDDPEISGESSVEEQTLAPLPDEDQNEPIVEEQENVVEETAVQEEESHDELVENESQVSESSSEDSDTSTDDGESTAMQFFDSLIAKVYAEEAETNGEINDADIATDAPLAKIVYSVDGETWKALADISTSDWHNARFEITDPDVSTWADVSQLRIAITIADEAPEKLTAYLESVSIEAQYHKAEDPAVVPTVMITDESLSIVDGDTDFAPNALPTFIVEDPKLSIEQVTELVAENKAEVILDITGVLAPESEIVPTLDAETPSPIVEQAAEVIAPIVETLTDATAAITEEIVSTLDVPVVEADEPQTVEAVVLDRDGNVTDIVVTVETIVENGVEKQKITIHQPERAFKPGRYTLKVSLMTPQMIIISEQDFTWGVLSINTSKSIYVPGDNAYLQMGVLDDNGHTICNADLTLRVTGPGGYNQSLSTDNGTIVKNTDCQIDNVIMTPDYYAHLNLPSAVGTYSMHLTAMTDNGEKSITDYFKIASRPKFDVRRTGPSRIYPGAPYPVTLYVTSETDWEGEVVEIVPESFDITQPQHSQAYESVDYEYGVQKITWNVSLEAGVETVLGYYFDAPDVSPEFYLLGPLTFFEDGEDIFHEAREWQVASDATCTTNGTGGGSWNTGATWSGCAGTGGVPAAGDNITILATDTVTMNVNSPALGTITVNGILNTSNGTSRSLTGTTLTIGSTGTLTANASTITLTGTTGTPLTLTAGGMFTAGTSTIALTGNNAAGNTTIPSNVSYYNLTVNNTSETFVLNGTTTINAAGVLTITLGTLDTTNSNYTLNAGRINLASNNSGCILTANASTINLTGTGVTLFTKASSAVFNAGTSTVALTGNGDATINATSSPTFYNMTSSGTGTKTLGLALTLNAAGTLSITNGTFSTSASNLSLSVGNLDVQSGGTFTANASAIGFTTTDGDPVDSTAGTLNMGTSTVSYTANNASGNTIISQGIPYYNLTVNNTSETFVLEGATTVNAAGTLTVSLGTLDTTSSNYTLTTGKIITANSASAIMLFNASTINITATSGTLFTKGSSSTVTAGTSTVNFSGNGDAALTTNTPPTFYNMTISGTGTKTLGAATTVSNTFSLTNGTLSTTASNFGLAAGIIDVQSGGTLTLNASTLTLSGTSGDPVLSTAGTFNMGTSTTTYTGNNGSGNTIINKDIPYYNLTINNSSETYELEGATTGNAGGTLTISAGTLDTTTNNYALSVGKIVWANSASAIVNARGSTITLTATSGIYITKPVAAIFTAGSSTVDIVGNGDVQILTSGTTITFYNLTLSGTGTKTAGITLTVSNVLSVSNGTLATGGQACAFGRLDIGASGTFSASSSSVTLNGTTGTVLTNAGTFDRGTSTVTLMGNNASGNTTISDDVTYYNLTLNNTSETYVLEGSTTIDPAGTLTVTLGTFDTTNNNYALSVGKVLIANTASAIMTLNDSNINVTGTSGNIFLKNSNGVMNPGTSEVTFSGNGDGNIQGVFYDVISSGTGIKTPGAGNLTVNHDLTVTNGILNAATSSFIGNGTNTLTVTNATLRAGAANFTGTYQSFETRTMGAGSVVEYNGTTQNVDSTISYVGLTISGASGTKSLNGTTTATGTVSIAANTLTTTATNYALNAGAIDIQSGATLTANASTITVAGNWTNAGTFTQGTSTVILNSATTAVVTGSTTFYNLTITHTAAKEVQFAVSGVPIYAVTNLFTVAGSAGNRIRLRSVSSGTKWQFNPTGTASVDYADVQDGGCEVGAITINTTNSINSGNNDSCWVFASAQTLSFSISDNSIGFGTLSSSTARFATGDTSGASSETEAHTISVATNATSGYTLSIRGATLTSGSNTINAIGGTNTASSTGSEQFGFRFTASGGIGAVLSPYAASGFAYAANATTPSAIASAASGDGATTTYSARSIANIAPTTEAGTYTTNIIYTVTANF